MHPEILNGRLAYICTLQSSHQNMGTTVSRELPVIESRIFASRISRCTHTHYVHATEKQNTLK